MYKHELCENIEQVISFLNENKIPRPNVISIMPFQTNFSDGASQLRREYEIIYYDSGNSTKL